MQVELLETFLDLCETRSFHRSAERLGVTQSTVSARIAALEGALGARLFHRSRSGTELTVEGARFAPQARHLRHGWAEARRSLQPVGGSAQTLRLGIQNDLAAGHVGEWTAEFRRTLPGAGFYIEADYSAQMCRDVLEGGLDLAVLYTPHPHPDLHFTELGEVAYHMVATQARQLADVAAGGFVFATVSPAFEALHRAMTPHLAASPLAAGQSATVAALVMGTQGAGYVLDRMAEGLVAAGRVGRVADAPVLRQTVHAAVHLRHRTHPLHRRLIRLLRRRLGGRA